VLLFTCVPETARSHVSRAAALPPHYVLPHFCVCGKCDKSHSGSQVAGTIRWGARPFAARLHRRTTNRRPKTCFFRIWPRTWLQKVAFSKSVNMGDRRRPVDYLWEIVFMASMASSPTSDRWRRPANPSRKAAGTYFLAKNIISSFANTLGDPEKEKHEQARIKAQAHLRRLRRPPERGEAGGDATDGSSGSRRGPRVEELVLNEYENVVALEVVAPEDISVGFDDIGGLSDIIEELKESVIYPLTMPHLYSHAAPLLAAPSGVLLYGPPGCGKTMLAKAVAHESGASFINLHISTLTEKWYGDSNKLVRAVFTLARKLQPAIIFIDEIDAVLGTRRSGEHEASGMVKAESVLHFTLGYTGVVF